MKVNQIVGEHKKGVRAMKYTKKPIDPSSAHTKAKEKLQAVKPMEGIEVKPMPGASQVVGADGKPIATTDAATANAIKMASDKGQFTPTDGTEAPVPEAHGDIGGDAGDDFIDDVVDHDFEKQADEGMFGFGNKTPEEWAKTSPQMATLLQFRAKAKGTQYEAQVEKRIQILKDRLDLDAGEVVGSNGAAKPVVPPEQFNMNQLREADDALLEKMRMIAGLR